MKGETCVVGVDELTGGGGEGPRGVDPQGYRGTGPRGVGGEVPPVCWIPRGKVGRKAFCSTGGIGGRRDD